MNQTSKINRCTPLKLTVQQVKILRAAPASSGKRFLLKHLDGGTLTRDQAIKAKCADCCGLFVDGRIDCEVPDCPLYPYMPYKKKGG